MGTFTSDCLEQAAAGRSGRGVDVPLIAVVGYDGSGPARRALEKAADLARSRRVEFEIVYVTHTPAFAGMSAQAVALVQQDFDEQATTLESEVRAQLDGREVRWHFQRRDGAVAAELQAVAEEIERTRSGSPEIVIVAGGSSHRLHHVAGSVGATLARHDRFSVIVVP